MFHYLNSFQKCSPTNSFHSDFATPNQKVQNNPSPLFHNAVTVGSRPSPTTPSASTNAIHSHNVTSIPTFLATETSLFSL